MAVFYIMKKLLLIISIAALFSGCGLVEDQNQLITYTLINFRNCFNRDISSGINDTLSSDFTYAYEGILMSDRDIALNMITMEMSTYQTMDIVNIVFNEVNEDDASVSADVTLTDTEGGTEFREW